VKPICGWQNPSLGFFDDAPQQNAGLCTTGCAAVLDSGTSLIIAPARDVGMLKAMLPPLSQDCSNFDAMPDLELVLGGHKMTLPPDAYVVRRSGQCVLAFQVGNHNTAHGPLWILGMPFFRFFHATFRNAEKMEDRRVFLMKAGDKCKPEPLKLEKVPMQSAGQLRSRRPPSFMPTIAVFNAQESRGPVNIEASDLSGQLDMASYDVL